MKVLHTADWHYRGKDLEEIDKCVVAIVDKARSEEFDLILISGDLTHSRSLQLESKAAQTLFKRVRELLDIAPVAIITGTPSHDGNIPLALRSLKGRYPILVSDMPEQCGYVQDDGWLDSNIIHENGLNPEFILTQLPTPTKQYFINDLAIEDSDQAISDAMDVMFSNYGYQALELFPDIPHIVSGHLTVGGAFISETQQLIGKDIEVSTSQLKALNADVICLGHYHFGQQIGNSNIFYAGSPYRLTFGEQGEKGFYIHELS